MKQEKPARKVSFLTAVSWLYLILSVAMIGIAIYSLTNESVKLTTGGVTDAVFAVILGAVGLFAGVLGLIGKKLGRCRLLGLILLVIAAIPLVINLLSGQTFRVYWKNIAVMLLPLIYLLAALFTREKKPAAAPEKPVLEAEAPPQTGGQQPPEQP